MAEKMTEREQFYYGKGYTDGKMALLKEIGTRIDEMSDYPYPYDAYGKGYYVAVNRVIDIINDLVGDSNVRE
jgi:hypothetical protein